MRLTMTSNSDIPSDSSVPQPAPGMDNIAEFTVAGIARAVRSILEGNFERVRVRGEVSRPNYHSSGHLYFTLKDADAVLDGVCWRGNVGRLGLTLEEGMEVVCTGRISSYARSSRYQIVIESVEHAGEGALLKLLEDRRRKLAKEGLFDDDRKQELPFLPDVIGVVTSPTGAVIRDILHRLDDRFPRRVILWPVKVQGEGAAEEIAAAIDGFNRLESGADVPRPDLLIVARGGGSLEDLWAFNEEVVVRATAASDIPLISAVGHETDTTLIDFAADLRAPTPSAAAEMAVPVRADLVAGILDETRHMVAAMERMWDEHRQNLVGLARGLPEPARLLEDAMQRLDGSTDKLVLAGNLYFGNRTGRVNTLGAALRSPADLVRHMGQTLGQTSRRLRGIMRPLLRDAARRLEGQTSLLDSLSYRNVLARGYALVRDDAGRPVFHAADAVPGSDIEIEFSDDTRGATLHGDGPKPRRRAGPAKRKKPSAGRKPKAGGDGSQGQLL
jgi:exodeoxyribonuclease VII large subunit